MSSHISKSVRSRWYVPSIALAMTAFAIAALAIYAVPSVHAAPPPGDCWGGALSDDPLHCRVLEEAQRDGIIEVETIYEGGGVLYVYLAQNAPVGDEVYLYIKTKGKECDGLYGCESGVLSVYTEDHLGYTLPRLAVYQDIMLRPGGADAVRSERGWAAFKQLWPEAGAGAGGAGGAAGAGGPSGSGSFDVSDIDLVNIPEVDCAHPRSWSSSCNQWQRLPSLGIAGWHKEDLGQKRYVQVKATSDDDPKVQAARERILQKYRKMTEDDLEIIPVKYDYEELWRWSHMVDRFVSSRGNTIGIREAWVDTNDARGFGAKDVVVFPLDDLKALPYMNDPEWGPYRDWASARETVVVSVLDAQRAEEALPDLLRQLGIPLDAVGMIVQFDETPPSRAVFLDLPAPAGLNEAASSDIATWREFSNWTLAGAGAGLLLLATLGSAIFIGVRRLARRRT